MPVNIVQVKECECVKCGYRWINHKNGEDGSIPYRCAKCKRPDWELGNISRAESRYRYELRDTFSENKMSAGRWCWTIDPKVDEFLKYRPSIEEMKVILEPICYLFKDSDGKIIRTIYDSKKYTLLLKKVWSNKDDYLRAKIRLKRDLEKNAVWNPVKAFSTEHLVWSI